MALQYNTATRNAILAPLISQIGNAALLRIYDGVKPADVAAPVTGNMLAELSFASPPATAPSGGVLTFSPVTSDLSANASGVATHFRIYQSDGTTAVMQGDVGTSGSDLNLDNVNIMSGTTVAVTSIKITAPGA